MEACRDMDVTVLYYTALKLFDCKTLTDNCESGNMLIVEPEYEGSLLYDIYKALPGKRLLIDEVAFPREIFRNYGIYDEKMRYYGLTVDNIKKKINKLF